MAESLKIPKRVVVVGAGALGSNLIPLLRNLDVDLHVVDCDKVEPANARSQAFPSSSVGLNKAQAMARLMLGFQVKVRPFPVRLAPANIREVVGAPDLVVDCVDNGETRRLLQAYAKASGIPLLHGALGLDGGFARVCWTEDFVVDDEPAVATPTCRDGGALPLISATSSLMARAVQEFLASGARPGFQVLPTLTVVRV